MASNMPMLTVNNSLFLSVQVFRTAVLIVDTEITASFSSSASFPGIFPTPAKITATSRFFSSQGWSDDKNWLEFCCIILQYLWISQFNSAFAMYKFSIPWKSTLDASLTVA